MKGTVVGPPAWEADIIFTCKWLAPSNNPGQAGRDPSSLLWCLRVSCSPVIGELPPNGSGYVWKRLKTQSLLETMQMSFIQSKKASVTESWQGRAKIYGRKQRVWVPCQALCWQLSIQYLRWPGQPCVRPCVVWCRIRQIFTTGSFCSILDHYLTKEKSIKGFIG